jgi:hypothetical protein
MRSSEQGHAERGLEDERSPPAELRHDEATRDRREHGPERHDHHQQRERARRFVRLAAIAHDRAPDYEACGAAESLHDTHQCERGHARGERAAGGTERIECEAEIQWRLATEAIADRSVEKLADCKAYEVRGHRGLDAAHTELALDGRETRQIHVDRDRTDGGHGRHQQQPARDARLH